MEQTRVSFTPTVVRALRELAAAAEALADHLNDNPGDGLGLSYATVFGPWERAESAMLRYQNVLR